MPISLAVPIHLDALYLSETKYVTEPTADFSRLPYFDKDLGRDINPDTPYLSEAILSKPFQDQRLPLKAGIHLHWSLPDALTQAQHQNNITTFPTVPNRWLITRSRQEDDQSFTVEKQWVVESDFLSDEGSGSIDYPYISEQMSSSPSSGRPFYYLGRKVPLDVWQARTADGLYLNQLTAVGYGEPTFAAFYPNCHSVFGFYDADYGAQFPANGLRYDVVGWYSNLGQDEFQKLLSELGEGQSWSTLVKNAFGWVSQANWTENNYPERMLCYAQITFEPASESSNTNPKLAEEAGVSVGNTATEALAAHLSSHFTEISPDELEDLLESLQLADHLEQKRLDVGPKFREGRHNSTFQSVSSGKLWTIRRKDNNSQGANVAQAQQREDFVLPAMLASSIDQLNRLQSEYDRAQQELGDRRAQLFADWYKYMVCVYPPETSRESYPDIDEVKHFIQTKDLDPLQYLQTSTGLFQFDSEGNVQEPGDDAGTTIAHQLKRAYNQVKQLVEAENQSTKAQHAKSELVFQKIAAPRYYLPNEPVVLFTGDAATPTNRHGQDGRFHPEGLLECLVFENADLSFDSAENIKKVREAVISQFASLSGTDNIAINTWKQQPWHPILLQWEVEFFPTRNGNNLDPENRRYQSDFIARNYTLPEKDVELRIKPDKIPPDKAVSVYSGKTILSSATQSVLSERILIYLEKHLLSEYYIAQAISEEQQTETYFEDNRATILTWYKTNGENNKFKMLIGVYEHLQENQGSNLFQSLGGFNDALLMHKVTRQTPIADPIGFDPYRTFTEQAVRDAVGQKMIKAPQPLDDFNPIRAGALKLLRLRLIDNFGIGHDVNVDNMTTTQQLRLENHSDWVAMLPRLAQPARINFRWLAANEGLQETNSHPETTPICGWLLPNNLDDSLAVYDQAGYALGSLYALPDPQNGDWAQWRSAPGQEQPIDITSIADAHLRKVIVYVQRQGPEYVGNFLAAIDTALAGIDPESTSQHRSQALLMGRPIAVVRARVNLELSGLPAINQGWNLFRQDLHRSRRETDDFTQVKFPIRIGEYHQLNDGLVGYWLEDSSFQIDYENSLFYAAQSEPNDSNKIVTYHSQPIVIEQAVDNSSQHLTMLLDPRGMVHATSGILPTKAISIPVGHYQEALRNIEITFFSAPILSEENQLDLPLPQEAGYLWSWLQKVDSEWSEFSTLRTIRRTIFRASIEENGEEIWQSLIQQGWLSPIDEETALVVAADQRPDLDSGLEPQQTEIERILDHPTVEPARVQAHFLSRPTVREGWLKLRQTPNTNEQNV